MESISITFKDGTLCVEGFPDAVKLLKIAGPKARRLADLALHREDLDFALQCLDAINQTSNDNGLLRTVLWQQAVISFIKCFGESRSRFSLHPNSVYTGDAGALTAYRYFLSLRHKNFVHDENSYTQSLPSAVL